MINLLERITLKSIKDKPEDTLGTRYSSRIEGKKLNLLFGTCTFRLSWENVESGYDWVRTEVPMNLSDESRKKYGSSYHVEVDGDFDKQGIDAVTAEQVLGDSLIGRIIAERLCAEENHYSDKEVTVEARTGNLMAIVSEHKVGEAIAIMSRVNEGICIAMEKGLFEVEEKARASYDLEQKEISSVRETTKNAIQKLEKTKRRIETRFQESEKQILIKYRRMREELETRARTSEIIPLYHDPK
jgi:hypothetical protein